MDTFIIVYNEGMKVSDLRGALHDKIEAKSKEIGNILAQVTLIRIVPTND